nr:MAG TPA: hypothetical protein [Caudoviricetes sp.]
MSDRPKFDRLLYIFYKGHCALYGDERFCNLFNFKMVSSTNFLLRWFDSSRRHINSCVPKWSKVTD